MEVETPNISSTENETTSKEIRKPCENQLADVTKTKHFNYMETDKMPIISNKDNDFHTS